MGKKRQTGKAQARRTERRRAARKRADAAVSAAEALPAVDALEDLPVFGDLRATDEQRRAFEEARSSSDHPDDLGLGCVVRLDRGYPLVVAERMTVRAEHAVGFAKQDKEKGDGLLPAVGDWVVLACPAGHDMGVIERVLPRRSAFERWRGRNRGERQTLAANVDEVLTVAALGPEPLPVARIARSLVLTLDCGAEPVVVLTKADRKRSPEDLEADLGRVRRLVGPEVRVAVTSSAAGAGLEDVRACIPAGTVAMILGESGAGKSTLLNGLLGHEALATGAVRARDDAGRHTTVARVMVKLPDAGVVADAPGLRSLPLVGHERGLARLFPEIVRAARGCRFNDCTHDHEPGCAVRAAHESGEIDSVRLDCYRSLAREMRVSAQSLDPDVVL